MTVTCLKSPINTTICLFWSYCTLKDSFPMVLQLELLFWLIFSRVVYIYVQLDMFEELYLRVFVFGVSFLCIQVAMLFYSYETVLQIVNISSEYLHAAIWYFLPLNLRIFFVLSFESIWMFLLHQDFDVREYAISVAGRLSEKNPAYVLPALRRHLIQLLTYLEQRWFSKGDRTVKD